MSIIQLCETISVKPGIININLSKNNVTDLACNAIKQMIIGSYALKELYLRWNKIT